MCKTYLHPAINCEFMPFYVCKLLDPTFVDGVRRFIIIIGEYRYFQLLKLAPCLFLTLINVLKESHRS